jgi:hypothetical protein
MRKLLKVGVGDPILRADPRHGLGAAEIFHPAIGIGDGSTVIGIDDVTLLRRWILESLGLGDWRESGEDEEKANEQRAKSHAGLRGRRG